MRKNREVGFSIAGFCLFFLTIIFTLTGSIIVYYLATKSTNNIWVVAFSVLGTIIVGATICTLFDIFRRKIMIEKPTMMILDATKRIASGDFGVILNPMHEYLKYDEYDLIFENINVMAKELSKNEILKNDFISNVSHEIKTPITVIQNYAKALQNDGLDRLERDKCLKGLVVQTQKLSGLISNILKLNKLENQEIVPEMEEIDLAELLRVRILSFENLLEKKDLKVECDIEYIKIVGSSSLLEIVLNNLISNAVKFTDTGGKITISLKEDDTHAIIKVKDTGCGISNEVGKHIFDKFYQGDTSHSSEGNGLGLALVKKVIDLIGGEISVESKVGVGTTFKLRLNKG